MSHCSSCDLRIKNYLDESNPISSFNLTLSVKYITMIIFYVQQSVLMIFTLYSRKKTNNLLQSCNGRDAVG